MNPRPDHEKDPAEETGTSTEHGRWTPEVSDAADREMHELLQEDHGPEPATETVDKTDLSLPTERRPIDH